jgi:predicted RNase H-like nuclease
MGGSPCNGRLRADTKLFMGSVLGVDGCRGGWIAARWSQHPAGFSFTLHHAFADLLAQHSDALCIAVDLPIGLSQCFSARKCDREARRLLGSRGSSVFPAPDRRLLDFHDDYPQANAFSKRECHKGISKQAFHIFWKIAEVDACMSADIQSRVFEVHPELSFQIAAERPLKYSKRKPEGYEERRQILSRHFDGLEFPIRSKIRALVPGASAAEVQPDDILDAMIAAWTALRRLRGEQMTVPSLAEYDPRGLRMEIVH